MDIIIITIIAVISGADTWNEIEMFGNSIIERLTKVLGLKHGIPSHDTFNRVFARLDAVQLEKCFINWMRVVTKLTDGLVIAIDGKTMRGSGKRGDKSFVHMVSAWANQNNLVLGQMKVIDKSNEITAIPQLIDWLVINGTIITIDAMGCQIKITSKIIEKGGNYLIAVKGNQEGLFHDTIDSFNDFKAEAVSHMQDFGHGRIEYRTCSVMTDLWMIDNKDEWAGLKTLVRIDALRIFKATGEQQKETRYYISSLPPDPVLINKSVRMHWGVENSLHWCLDVAFSEDASQKSKGHAARNFSIITRIALNLFKADKTYNVGIKSKRKIAGWDMEYMLHILNEPTFSL